MYIVDIIKLEDMLNIWEGCEGELGIEWEAVGCWELAYYG